MRVGVMGHPRRASAALGREANDDIINNLTARISKIEAGADGRYKKVKFTPVPLMVGDND